MGITTSYNRHNGIRYAYETTYEMDESAGKKVQRRRCIGHVDPKTGEIVPNGGRGRTRTTATVTTQDTEAAPIEGAEDTPARPSAEQLADVEASLLALARSCDELSSQLQALARKIDQMREM